MSALNRHLPLACAGLLITLVTMGARPPKPPVAVPPGPVALASVRLVAVGDILMHQDVKRSAAEAVDGFQELWADVAPMLKNADIAFANLETPVAPVSGRPGVPFQFNAPANLPAALRASGFTVLATANNHAFDQGVQGVRETLERLGAEHLITVGSGLTRAEAEAPRFLTVKGLRVAFLGFTDLFNVDLNGKRDAPWVRHLDLAAAAQSVRQARAQADFVVVSLHWGVEFQHEPRPRQQQAAAALAEAGAGLILGHHPHVLQPVTWVGQGTRRALVAYSMGNFIANQNRTYDADLDEATEGDTRDGVAVQCQLVRHRLADGTQEVTVEDVRCEPLWTDNNGTEHRAGKAKVRLIRVVPMNGAIRAALKAVEAASAPTEQSRLQARLRTLQLRRARAA
jgi:poly-gamma-glutamate synthesis protein (capsule biosynthesis protein)